MLLALQGLALGIGFMILGWMLAVHRRNQLAQKEISPAQNFFPQQITTLQRPECSWAEGLAGAHEFFISPRVNGWVIVTGLALPNPTEDVDATFLFLTGLSRQLGHVQYFYASRLFHHHAWARLDDGCVTRAYAWTGETVWQQGVETLPEIKTDVKLFAYGDYTATLLDAEMNFEKVPQLAARWSLDPARVKLNSFRQAKGSAGESAFG